MSATLLTSVSQQEPKLVRKNSFSKLTKAAFFGKSSKDAEASGAAAAADDVDNSDQWETQSNSSRTSSSSLTSKVSSMKKKLGNPFRSSSNTRGGASASKLASVPKLAPGDVCEALAPLTVRVGENPETEATVEMPIGSAFEVVEVGRMDRNRIKVKSATAYGWVSCLSHLGHAQVAKAMCDTRLQYVLTDFQEGGKYEVKSAVTVRIEEEISSESKAVLKPGAHITILEINGRRAKINATAGSGLGVTGWISLASKDGELLVGKIPEAVKASSSGGSIEFTPKFMKIKSLLEASVRGDVAALKKALETSGGVVSRLLKDPTRPDINSTDVRGLTPLMYAATYVNQAAVEFLLSRTEEIDVHALDNTLKSVLHHAAKRVKAKRTPEFDQVQSSIVMTLLHRGANIEARDQNGCTPLMFAVANGDEAVTRTLLVSEANVSATDFEGRMPMDYAVNFGHDKLVKMLKSAGAVSSNEDSQEDELETQAKPAAQTHASSECLNPFSSNTPVDATIEAGEAAEVPAVEESQGKQKKKKVTKKKSKKGSSRQAASAGMLEAVEMVDDAPQVAPVDDAVEGLDERQEVLAKLKVLMETSVSVGEMKAAIKLAQAAGVAEVDLEEATQYMKALRARGKALDKLMAAIAERDVWKLKAAMSEAEEAGASADHDWCLFEEARVVLAEEEPRVKAWERLCAARDNGDIDKLKTALAKARKVGLALEDLAEFEELLACAASKEKAEDALVAAMEQRDVAGLKFAISQAKEVGVDGGLIKQAKAVLKEEQPKQAARKLLAQAAEALTIDALREALDAAYAANLDVSETKEVQAALHREEEKERLMGRIMSVMQEVKNVDVSNIDALREAKDQLSSAIQEALSAGCAESNLLEAETRRKKLHNAIEDLKGSIRVFCRVRPLSGKEIAQGDDDITGSAGSMGLTIEGHNQYNFDAVFKPGSQDEVFEDCKDLVQSAVDGYNVTMFAYGQTGAGKTFTMYGCPGAEGTAPRTIHELYRVIKEGETRCSYTVMASMLELYRNNFVDLLVKGNGSLAKTKPPNVRQDKTGAVSIENLTEEQCQSAQELMDVLQRGNEQRTVAATAMNADSSRSHLVLLIRVVSVNKETQEIVRGKILICDLAGSERLKKSQVSDEMEKEAIEINKSLTALGDVIEALTKNQKVIPYRNHKLTQLMQDSLGGTAKTLMFVNCSPASSNLDETVTSLKYAARAKTITNTTAKNA